MEKIAHLQIGSPVADIHELLERLFWKQPQMSRIALHFLTYLRQWGRSETPFRVSQWETYCAKKGITQSQYHNMLKRLRRAGMVDKRYNKVQKVHELFLCEDFSQHLTGMSDVWDDFKAGQSPE